MRQVSVGESLYVFVKSLHLSTRNSVMAKAMTVAGMVVAGLFVLLFGMDLAVRIPFQRASAIMDIGFLISGLILGYCSWNAFRDVR